MSKIEKLDRYMAHLDMFYRDILIVFGNEEQTRETLHKYYDEDELDGILIDATFDGKGWTKYTSKFNSYIVWLPDNPKTAEEVGFLVHELFHATYAVMCNVGINLSEDSEEVFAYTIGFLTEKVLGALPTFSCPSQ